MGYIREVSVQLIPKYFHIIAVLIVLHAAVGQRSNNGVTAESAIGDNNVFIFLAFRLLT